jgi:hypothetical protein
MFGSNGSRLVFYTHTLFIIPPLDTVRVIEPTSGRARARFGADPYFSLDGK